MKTARVLFLAIAVAVLVKSLPATTVIPPSFDELVQQAELIFQGNVVDVRSYWTGEGAQRHIMSDVTFAIEETIKGAPSTTYTLTMLGGTVDGETLQVADAPQFKRGDRDILFVENNGSQFIPLVGIMHGRFRVEQDRSSSEGLVASNDGKLIVSEGRALRPSEFKAAVRGRLNALTR